MSRVWSLNPYPSGTLAAWTIAVAAILAALTAPVLAQVDFNRRQLAHHPGQRYGSRTLRPQRHLVERRGAGVGTSLSCAAAINGALRYSSTSNTLQICVGTTWTSLVSGTAGAGTLTGTGSATAVAYWSGASGLTYDDGFYYNATSNRLGIGTNTPSGALHRERHHLPRRHDQQQHNPAHAVRTLLGLDCRKCGCNDRPTACARRRLQTVPDDVDGPGFDLFPTALVEYTGNRRPIADGKRWFCGYRYESPERDPQCDRQQLGRGRNGGDVHEL